MWVRERRKCELCAFEGEREKMSLHLRERKLCAFDRAKILKCVYLCEWEKKMRLCVSERKMCAKEKCVYLREQKFKICALKKQHMHVWVRVSELV